MSLRVAVVQGGPSTEAEVSRASADAVTSALRAGTSPSASSSTKGSRRRWARWRRTSSSPSPTGPRRGRLAAGAARGAGAPVRRLRGAPERARDEHVARGVWRRRTPGGARRHAPPRTGRARPRAAGPRRRRTGRRGQAVHERVGHRIVCLSARTSRTPAAEAIDAAFAPAVRRSSASSVGEVWWRVRSATAARGPAADGDPGDRPRVLHVRSALRRGRARTFLRARARSRPRRAPRVAVAAHAALGCRPSPRRLRARRRGVRAGPPHAARGEHAPGFTATSLFPEAAAAGLPLAALCDHLVRGRTAAPPRRAGGAGAASLNAARTPGRCIPAPPTQDEGYGLGPPPMRRDLFGERIVWRGRPARLALPGAARWLALAAAIAAATSAASAAVVGRGLAASGGAARLPHLRVDRALRMATPADPPPPPSTSSRTHVIARWGPFRGASSARRSATRSCAGMPRARGRATELVRAVPRGAPAHAEARSAGVPAPDRLGGGPGVEPEPSRRLAPAGAAPRRRRAHL